jgi:hypothetical protein
MLLDDFEVVMRRQAEDLARCRAWSLAFGAMLGSTAALDEINPLTGQPFGVEQTAQGVRVSGVLEPTDEPVFFPKRPAIRTARLRNAPPLR